MEVVYLKGFGTNGSKRFYKVTKGCIKYIHFGKTGDVLYGTTKSLGSNYMIEPCSLTEYSKALVKAVDLKEADIKNIKSL